MRFVIRKCSACGQYTLKDECKKCNKKTMLVHPAKFSPDDKYMRLRIANKTWNNLAKCPNCGKEFVCGIECDSNDCWCFSKEKKQPTGDKCVCEECLDKMN